MRSILVTGAAGFIGRALVDVLGAAQVAAVDHDAGDIADPAFVKTILTPEIEAVFHLAGIMSGASEQSFDAGMHVNLDGMRVLLEAARHLPRPRPIRLVYASSIGVYGVPLPDRIDDATTPVPTLSYGAQKLIGETLLNDYSRRGYVDGIALRLPGIVVRPPAPNGALSAFNSDIIREPLAGREIVSPVSGAATLWMMSIRMCVRNFLHALTLPTGKLGAQRALLMPAVVTSVDGMLDAVSKVGAFDARRHVRFAPDPVLEPMFGRWPALDAARASALGFGADADIEAIVRDYASEA